MSLLKESIDVEEYRNLHYEIWTKLQEHDELYVKTFLENSLKSLEKKRGKLFSYETLLDYFKSPIIWISIIVGVLIVPIFCFLVIWISLIIE
ncbi:hypothetical protein ACFQZT_26590 [Paenibacillus sp. GCM10027628]|uniref:hypothetical protein n=1 Tax=Paenibacillus sp. GCM10027628 TaxID=3273413 RepID=UPI003625711F